MQRKILNTKYKLHSIPILSQHKNDSDSRMKNNVESSVLYSIPCVKACAHSFCGIKLFNSNKLNNAFAILCLSIISLVSLMGGDKCSAATSASLSLSNPNMTSSTITPGSTATVSTNVTVSVDNAESYSLSLKVDNANLTNGSTTITAGNVVSDNTWGYKWDNASTYTTPSTSGTTLTNSTLIPLDSNGAVSFTKNLTFGAKFASNAEAGHYRGSGVLSLVATPKATLGMWTLADGSTKSSGITTMQEMTSAVCNQVSTPTAIDAAGSTNAPTLVLSDSRDGSPYTIAKLPDGKCWMVENLHLSGGRTLTSSDSNVTNDFDLPVSLTKTNLNNATGDVCSRNFYDGGSSSNTSCYTKAQSYIAIPSTEAGITGYYSWYAVTAGTGNASIATDGTNVNSSICPKGWALPAGLVVGANTRNDFYDLFSKMNLGVTINTSGGTSWGSSQGLAISQGSPYNFAYPGLVGNGSLGSTTTHGYWWSRTTSSSIGAYDLLIYSSSVFPGTDSTNRSYGLAVRCVAEEHITYILSYDINRSGASAERIEYFATKYPTQTSSNKTFTIPNESIAMDFGGSCTYKLLGFSDVTSGSVKYNLGQEITLGDTSSELTLYALWALNGCS